MLPMRKAFVLILAAVLLSGCNFIYRQPVFQGNLLEKSDVEQLKPGMTRAQVVSLVGTPPIADPFHQERWDYIATERRRHGKTDIKDLTLWFEGDVLARMEGEYFPEKDPELLVEIRKFGFFNLPKEKDKDKRGSR
ncbi:MAG: outer membrane protein assembly factor BamE [Arenimonas sp.]